jgi:hypothetical protein
MACSTRLGKAQISRAALLRSTTERVNPGADLEACESGRRNNISKLCFRQSTSRVGLFPKPPSVKGCGLLRGLLDRERSHV